MATVPMRISDSLVAELNQEAVATRKMLERVPEGDFGWKPHEKSMSLGMLASHLADLPEWTLVILDRDALDFTTQGYQPWVAANRAELVAKFDECLAAATAALSACSDEQMLQPWRFSVDGAFLFELPRVVTVRNMVMNHLVHHRGQLSVYLRLRDVPLPSTYGPSADEAS